MPKVIKGITRYCGEDLAESTAQKVQTNDIGALIELISNSYNADATRVDILLDYQKKHLIVKDDGIGMNVSTGLKDFYRLGDSQVKSEPISQKGRKRLGGHGTATLVLKRLAQGYVMTSKRGGLETKVMEKFVGPIQLGQELHVLQDTCLPNEHGTAIQMTHEKYSNETGLDLKKLANTIRMELPILPDFNVFINGEKIMPRAFSSATKFDINTTGKYMGHVKGTIYLLGQKSPARGVNLYVNGRRYGSPTELLDLPNFGMTIANRAVAIIDANDLKGAILLDRGRLNDSDPGYIELKNFMQGEFTKIRRYLEQNTSVDNIQKVKSGTDEYMVRLARKMIESKMQIFTKETKIKFAKGLEGTVGHIDFHKNILFLNEEHPYFTVTSATSKDQYHNNISTGVIEVLATHLKKEDTINAFLDAKSEIISKMQKAQLDSDKNKKRIHSNVVYSLPEFSTYSGMGIGAARHLVKQGLVKVTEEEGVVGSTIESYVEKNKGFIPMYELIQKHISPVVQVFLEKYDGLFEDPDIQKVAEPFIFNKGNGTPCYFVEQAFVDLVVSTLKTADQRKKNFKQETIDAFNKLKDTYLSLGELTSKSSGLQYKEVQEVTNWAKQNNEKIKLNKGDYHLGDFVKCYQKMRLNPSKE